MKTFFIIVLLGIIKVAISNSPPILTRPSVHSIKLNGSYLYPPQMRESKQDCLNSNTIEVAFGQQMVVRANAPFSLFFNAQISQTYYNLQHFLGQNSDDLNMNLLILSHPKDQIHQVSFPISLKCEYKASPYLRLNGQLSIKFTEEGQIRGQSYKWELLLVCAGLEQVDKFMVFYVPSYVAFWVGLNLVLQVYHDHPGGNVGSVALFAVYILTSLMIEGDIMAYLSAGLILLCTIFKEKRQRKINSKMFCLYMFFLIIIGIQVLLTIQGGKEHQLWNPIWMAMDNFIFMHISMFLALRLIKLSRFRHVFWYFIVVAAFSTLQLQNNRFFQLQFRNPLNLQCIKRNLFFSITMLPISNYFSTITTWMYRIFGLFIIFVSLINYQHQSLSMGIFITIVLLFQIYRKDIKMIFRKQSLPNQ